MTVAHASSAPTSIIHARNDEPHMLTDMCPIKTQYEKFNSDPTINAGRYKSPKHLEEQLDDHNGVN